MEKTLNGQMIKPNRKKRSTILKMCDGQMVSDVNLIPDIMNQYFCDIGPQLQKKFPGDYEKYLSNRVFNSFYLDSVTENDVLVELNKIDLKKSSGPEKFNAKLIQLCPEVFAANLTKIYNRSIEEGKYPTSMKVA